jgi:ABC-type uncharacterized transport system auxiliary subunit
MFCSLLAGCGEQGVPVPSDRFHRLIVGAPETVFPSPKLSGTLEVERFRADGVLQNRAIVFIEHDSPNVMHQYNYHLWADAPTRMLQSVTVEYLRDARLADQVVISGSRIDPSYTLIGDIKKLEHMVGDSSSVVVEIEFGLREHKDGSVVWLKNYTASKTVKDNNVGTASVAISESVEQILHDLSADLARR